MKIRVTLMTENDKHDENVTEEQARKAWSMVCEMLSAMSGGDKCVLEDLEIIEK